MTASMQLVDLRDITASPDLQNTKIKLKKPKRIFVKKIEIAAYFLKPVDPLILEL
jgi:hypothetical protein